MLRIHFMKQCFNLSDPAMDDALHDVPLFRDLGALDGWDDRLPDESTILRFRNAMEKHKLAPHILMMVNDGPQHNGLLRKSGTVVDPTLIAAPSSTKNTTGERIPEMKQSKKGNHWHCGRKDHISTDGESGKVHTVRCTIGNVNDLVETNSLLHGQETEAWGDAGFQGAAKRPDSEPDVRWMRWKIAMRTSKRHQTDAARPMGRLTN